MSAQQEGLVSDRKYRQRGYQDSGEKREKASPERPAKQDTFGPRRLQMPGTHTVSRCAQCGNLLAAGTESTARCAKCGFELSQILDMGASWSLMLSEFNKRGIAWEEKPSRHLSLREMVALRRKAFAANDAGRGDSVSCVLVKR